MEKLETEVKQQAAEKGIKLADNAIDDALIVALFPQVGLKFLQNRNNPSAFEPVPSTSVTLSQPIKEDKRVVSSPTIYTVELEGKAFVVKVSEGGEVQDISSANTAPVASQVEKQTDSGIEVIAPLTGNIWKVFVTEGQQVAKDDVLLMLEAMKMETEIRAAQAGTVQGIRVKAGDTVSVGDCLMKLA